MRGGLIVLWMVLCSVTSAVAQVSIGIGLPHVSIGINLPLYPELVPVPGYPVYYAPRMEANYFFYDGLYWVYQGDNWYASSWYNGPWWIVGPEAVPVYVLRIPVSYYRRPSVYFRGWRPDAPPRWGEHWGRDWEQRRTGWDKWNRGSVPKPAPLPVYQRQYSGDRYPRVEQQHALRSEHYRYQPRDAVVQQHYRAQAAQAAPAPVQREPLRERQERSPGQQLPPGAAQREQRAPMSQGQEQRPEGRAASQEPQRSQGQGQEKGRGQDEERGRERNR
jgi:hypothetical protein